jgi:hypothetical protein
VKRLLLAAALVAPALATATACGPIYALGAIGNEFERNKKIEVLAEYEGLENRTIAVIVDADASVRFQFPTMTTTVAANIAYRIQTNVRGASLLAPATVAQWQYQTPAWTTLPYGQIADELGVERVVLVDIYEFRLNPPGNQYMWEGAAAANVSIIERENPEPDAFAATFDIRVNFPGGEIRTRESISPQIMYQGLMTRFVQKAAWLFYTHLEDKYPDA